MLPAHCPPLYSRAYRETKKPQDGIRSSKLGFRKTFSACDIMRSFLDALLAWEDLTQTRPRTRRQEEKDAYELCPQQARKQDLRAKVFTLLQEAPWVLAVTTSLKGRVNFGIVKLPSMRESAREVDSLSRHLASHFTAHLTAHGVIEKRNHWSMKWFKFARSFGTVFSQ